MMQQCDMVLVLVTRLISVIPRHNIKCDHDGRCKRPASVPPPINQSRRDSSSVYTSFFRSVGPGSTSTIPSIYSIMTFEFKLPRVLVIFYLYLLIYSRSRDLLE